MGGFLIYNTMSFSVIQRRRLLAILRTLGVTRGQLGRNLLFEALALGIAGSAFGLLVGVLLSRSLVRLTARAVSDLYFAVSVTEVPIAVMPLVRGFALGVLASVASAWPSARDAASTDPHAAMRRSTVEARARARTPRLAIAGALLAAVSVVALDRVGAQRARRARGAAGVTHWVRGTGAGRGARGRARWPAACSAPCAARPGGSRRAASPPGSAAPAWRRRRWRWRWRSRPA